MKTLLALFIALFSKIALTAESPCPSSLLKMLQSPNATLIVCQLVSPLVPEKSDRQQAFVVRDFRENASETSGITVSIFQQTDRKLEFKSLPVYEESGFGKKLIPFKYDGKSVKFQIADFTGKGHLAWAIRAASGTGSSVLFIKQFDGSKFDLVGYQEKTEHGLVNGSDSFTGTETGEISVDGNGIEIAVPSGVQKYSLRNGQFIFDPLVKR